MNKNKIENLLVITLWIMLSILCVCFWFNVMYGFNIFSNSHWQHLSYMQASQTPVKTSFYISLVMSVIIVLGGLFIIIHPRLRHIKIQTHPKKTPPVPQQPDAPAPVKTALYDTEPDLVRPRRLNTHKPTVTATTDLDILSKTIPQTNAPVAPMATVPEPDFRIPDTPTPSADITDTLTQIFQDAGYTIKTAPYIHGTHLALFALGANETIWVGAADISTDIMDATIDVIKQVFIDTLDDITINVKSFIISPTNVTPGSETITFDTIDDVRTYMARNHNPEISESDQETFDAFSSYIDTVINYLGTL